MKPLLSLVFLPLIFATTCDECRWGATCENGSCVCPGVCDDQYEPCCGTDGRTYPNQCELDRTRCNNRGSMDLAYAGECSSDHQNGDNNGNGGEYNNHGDNNGNGGEYNNHGGNNNGYNGNGNNENNHNGDYSNNGNGDRNNNGAYGNNQVGDANYVSGNENRNGGYGSGNGNGESHGNGNGNENGEYSNGGSHSNGESHGSNGEYSGNSNGEHNGNGYSGGDNGNHNENNVNYGNNGDRTLYPKPGPSTRNGGSGGTQHGPRYLFGRLSHNRACNLACRRGASCVIRDGDATCQCDTNCPTTLQEVCGTDGKTYANDCRMDMEYCTSNGDVDKDYDGACSSNHHGHSNNDDDDDNNYHGDNNSNRACSISDWTSNYDNWPISRSDSYESYFNVNGVGGNPNFNTVINYQGSNSNETFLRQSVCALLNSYNSGWNYPYSTSEVKNKVQNALWNNNRMQSVYNDFQNANSRGNCPY